MRKPEMESIGLGQTVGKGSKAKKALSMFSEETCLKQSTQRDAADPTTRHVHSLIADYVRLNSKSLTE